MNYRVVRTPNGMKFVPVEDEKIIKSTKDIETKPIKSAKYVENPIKKPPTEQFEVPARLNPNMNATNVLSDIFGVKAPSTKTNFQNVPANIEFDPEAFLNMLFGNQFAKMNNAYVKAEPRIEKKLTPKPVLFNAALFGGCIGETVYCEIAEVKLNEVLIRIHSLQFKNWRAACIGLIRTTMNELEEKFGDYIPEGFHAIIRNRNRDRVEVDMDEFNRHRNIVPDIRVAARQAKSDSEILARTLGEMKNAAKLSQFKMPEGLSHEASKHWENAYRTYLNGLDKLFIDVAKALDA